MKAILTKNDTYYVLTMDGREIGGTNKNSLIKYAKIQGYEVEFKDVTPKHLKVEHGFDSWRA